MQLQLNLPEAVGQKLEQQAKILGHTTSELAIELIQKALTQTTNNSHAAQMLLNWIEEDEQLSEEQLQRHQEVLKAIDADRLSDRQLFEQVLTENSK